MSPSKKRHLFFTLTTVILVFTIIEGISWLSLWVLDKHFRIFYQPILTSQLSSRHQKALDLFIKNDIDHTEFSATLGWTIKPNGSSSKGAYISNSKRIRARQEYNVVPPVDKVRIATFGDSFTYGMEVRNEQTWQAQLTDLNNNVETLNFGIGGHGLDQAYLRYLSEGAAYSADIVVVGYMTENINRIVSVYRPYYVQKTGIPLTKPRFVLKNDELKLIKNPHQQIEDYNELLTNPKIVLPILGKHDFHYSIRYAKHSVDFLRSVRLGKIIVYDLFGNKVYDLQGNYNNRSEAFPLLFKLLEAFHRSALKNGSLPVILIYPDLIDVNALRYKKAKRYQSLISWLMEKNFVYVDLIDVVTLFSASNEIKEFFTKSFGHYSPLGNQFVAKHLHNFLITNRLTTKQDIKTALANRKIQ